MIRAVVLAAVLAAPTGASATPSEHRLEDGQGRVVATFVVRPDTASSISVPPGNYVHVQPDGTRSEVRIGLGERFVASGAKATPPPAKRPLVARPQPEPGVPGPRTDRKGPVKHAWAAPLLASFLPGTGHAIARRPGAAFGWFAAAAGLTFGSVALGLSADNREGATPGDAGRSGAREAIRHGAFVVATDALALVWIGQAADAWVAAKRKIVRAKKRHVIAVSLQRATTVGIRPGEPSMARYEDLTIGVLGQVIPRLSVGVADLGVHGRSGGRLTLQAGLRAAGRVLQRDRVWLVVAGGVIFQGTSGSTTLDTATPRRERGRFGATGYAQLETRVFVLDRLSLDIGPRFSVPFATRYYGGGRALPRWAPTVELVAGTQVYF